MSKLSNVTLSREKFILSKHGTVIAAAQELGVSIDSLQNKFRRAGDNASKYLGAKPRSAEDLSSAVRTRAKILTQAKEAKGLAKRVVELEDALAFMHARPEVAPIIKTPRARPKDGKRPGTPVFVLSDLHFGETVTRAESLGTNEYDLAIAAKRMRECWDNMLWLRNDMSRNVQCDDTLVCLNGDIVSGNIHPELLETNDGGIGEQCDAATDALYPGLKELADATPGTMHVVCIGGNHGRLTHKQQIKNGTEHSAEHLGVYGPLRRMFKGAGYEGKISWHIPKAERYIIDVHGKRVSVQHGTMIRSQGGIGGTLVPMTRWAVRANDADLYVFGHFHEADAYGRIIKNGALIGESAYTKWLGVESRPPEQVAFIVDPDHGVRRFERVSVT